MREYRTIVVPYDFSGHARAALGMACDLARHFDGTLHLLHVIQPPMYAIPGVAELPSTALVDLHDGIRESLEQVAAKLALPRRAEAHVVEAMNIASAIDQYAEHVKADLIVMGTHGRTGLAHAFMGSVTERTLRSAPCPVLTLRSAEETEESPR
jgi:nucleotide-binding universal stress UspA family protein